jgi:hypothetical protein
MKNKQKDSSFLILGIVIIVIIITLLIVTNLGENDEPYRNVNVKHLSKYNRRRRKSTGRNPQIYGPRCETYEDCVGVPGMPNCAIMDDDDSKRCSNYDM